MCVAAQLYPSTWRSSWLHATTHCINGLLAAPEENQSFTLTLLLFYGFGLENTSAEQSAGLQFIHTYQIFVSGGEGVFTRGDETNKICFVVFSFIIPSRDCSCKLLQRDCAVKYTETQPLITSCWTHLPKQPCLPTN